MNEPADDLDSLTLGDRTWRPVASRALIAVGRRFERVGTAFYNAEQRVKMSDRRRRHLVGGLIAWAHDPDTTLDIPGYGSCEHGPEVPFQATSTETRRLTTEQPEQANERLLR